MRPNAVGVQHWKIRQAGVVGGVLLNGHVTTLGAQEMRNGFHRRTGAVGVVFAHQGDMAELRLHR